MNFLEQFSHAIMEFREIFEDFGLFAAIRMASVGGGASTETMVKESRKI